MMGPPRAALVLLAVLAAGATPMAASADNTMGYRLLTPEDAAALPRNHGAIGLEVERGQQITDQGLTFDIMKITRITPRSAGAAAGFKPGDQVIAADGEVFPTIATFAAYIGSHAPGTAIHLDYMQAGAGPGQAQRVTVVLGAPGMAAPQQSHGLSTGAKVAIGVGAAALLCYEMKCLSRVQRQKAGAGSAGGPGGQAPVGQP